MGAYVVAARAKGISERAVAYRHVLPNGMLPTITIIGIATGSLLSSLVIVESVFSWPGLGSLLVQSVTDRDFNTVVAIVLLTAAAFVVTSIIVDLIYWFVDPRTRRPGEVSSATPLLSSLPRRVFRAVRAFFRLPKSLIAAIFVLFPFAFMAAFPSILAPYNPYSTIGIPLAGPSSSNWLGTDEIGRDILSRVIYSAQSDVVISLAATVIAFVVGSLVGISLGYQGGKIDTAGTRVVDIMLAFPAIVLALFLIAIFGHGELVEIIAIAGVMMPSMARFARGTTLLLRNRGIHRVERDPPRVPHVSDPSASRPERVAIAARRGIGSRGERGSHLRLTQLLGARSDPANAELGHDALQRLPERLPGARLRRNARSLYHGARLRLHAAGRGLGQLQGHTGRQERAFRSSVTRV